MPDHRDLVYLFCPEFAFSSNPGEGHALNVGVYWRTQNFEFLKINYDAVENLLF